MSLDMESRRVGVKKSVEDIEKNTGKNGKDELTEITGMREGMTEEVFCCILIFFFKLF